MSAFSSWGQANHSCGHCELASMLPTDSAGIHWTCARIAITVISHDCGHDHLSHVIWMISMYRKRNTTALPLPL